MTNRDQDTSSVGFLVAWVLLSTAAIAAIAVVLNAAGSQLGEAGRVLAIIAALTLIGAAVMAYGQWARRRQANRELIDAWLSLANKIGSWAPHETEDLVDVLKPLVNKGTVAQEDAINLVYWLQEALYKKTSVPTHYAITARETLDKIRI